MRRFQGFICVVALLLMAALPSAIRAGTIADSVDDWSTVGTQGENNWWNGFYNLTVDQDEGDGVYQPGDFIEFLNDGTGLVLEDEQNNWDGGAWRLYRDTVNTPAGVETGPWTTLGAEGGHPSGTNSAPPILVDNPPSAGQEHWAIRRWVSTYDGPAYLITDMIDNNPACGGDGTTVELYKNGELLDSNSALGEVGVLHWIESTLAAGDILDFALTPEGLGGGRSDGCDGTNFRLTVSDERPPDPPDPPTPPLADSTLDWSTTGTQGEKNWFNGYYNRTQDPDGEYQQEDFIAFTNSAGPAGGPTEPDGNHWTGAQWDLTTEAMGPWTALGLGFTHPNGTNSAPNDEHWTVRRWVADDVTKTTPLALNWKTAKANTDNDGVTGVLFVNGEMVDSATIAGSDTVGVDRTFYINAEPGDVIDLALTPQGMTNDGDGSDGSNNRLTVKSELPDGPLFNPGRVFADSVREFSGEQGQDGWLFGYYDQRLDAEEGDAVYGVDDFIAFENDGSGVVSTDPGIGEWKEWGNAWNGNSWDLLQNDANLGTDHGPWTALDGTGGHPAANAQEDPEVHWVIRRWVSDSEGEANLTGLLNRPSTDGDGTVGRILVDGVEIWSELADGTADVPIDLTVTLTDGMVIDFAIDPDGAGVFDPADPLGTIDLVNDGSDRTNFSVRLQEFLLFIPEGLTGDYNNNGELDVADLDLQAVEIAGGQDPADFDLTGDDLVNEDDRVFWLHDLKGTWVGDADLDGLFDSLDFVAVFVEGLYETGEAAGWAQGDWNADLVFDSGDFVAAFVDGGYEAGAFPGAVQAVPEPSSLVLALLSLAGLIGLARRR